MILPAAGSICLPVVCQDTNYCVSKIVVLIADSRKLIGEITSLPLCANI